MNIFHNQVNLLVNLESLHDNHDKRLFESVFITCHLVFRTRICHRLFQNKVNLRVLNCGWPFKRDKDNSNPHRDEQNEAAAAQ